MILRFNRTAWLVGLLIACSSPPGRGQDAPRVLDARLKLEVFARDPDIVTPTGATCDRRGRLLVIESHTHQRPEQYAGPRRDRIRLLEDTDGDGKADRFQTFFEGTEATMSIVAGPDDWVYVATRQKIFRLRDSDGDDRADQQQRLVHLETRGNYPHNGLSGLALDGRGGLYFGMGENLGRDFRMVAAGGGSQRGSGEGGVFYCTLQGEHLTRIATGFWNPFGICVDPFGRVFAVGNDADGRPPCRLVHVVPTGDYGFQFRYGRSGRHPLQAWDGELPGTLPMVTGTGEAPCEVAVHNGRLWVGIWGDYRIERYELAPVGASFQARREVVVQGDEKFRPVAFASGPDGSLYFTDWVSKSYPVHGQGKVWRLSYRQPPKPQAVPAPNEAELRARGLATETKWRTLTEALKTDDLFLRQGAVAGMTRSKELLKATLDQFSDPRQRLGLLQALRWKLDHSRAEPGEPPLDMLEQALDDRDADVRLYAVRWAADAELKSLRDSIEGQLTERSGATPALFQATVAALEVLDTGKTTFDPQNAAKYFVRILHDPPQPLPLRRLALRMLPHDSIVLNREQALLAGDDPTLRRDLVRTLVMLTGQDKDARRLLAKVALDDRVPDAVRADALVGLAHEDQAPLLHRLSAVRGKTAEQAARSLDKLRGDAKQHEHPSVDDEQAWLERVGRGGDADEGWRVFFGAGSVSCSKCHRYRGRGASVGPDLTGIAARTSRRDVLQSLLKPSKDMAPRLVPTILRTTGGEVLQGLWQGHDPTGKRELYLASNGTTFEVDPGDVESRRLSDVSIMPEGLYKQLSAEDIRNLLALFSAEDK